MTEKDLKTYEEKMLEKNSNEKREEINIEHSNKTEDVNLNLNVEIKNDINAKKFEDWMKLKSYYNFVENNVGNETEKIPSYTFQLGNRLMGIVQGQDGFMLYETDGSFIQLKSNFYEDPQKMIEYIENIQARGNNPKNFFYKEQMANYIKVDSALAILKDVDNELYNELNPQANQELDGNEEHEISFMEKFNGYIERFKETLVQKTEEIKAWCYLNEDKIKKGLAVAAIGSLFLLPKAQSPEIQRETIANKWEPISQETNKSAQLEQGDITIDLQEYEVKMNMHEIYGEELAKANGQGAGQIENKEESKVVETESNAKVEKEEDKVIIEDLEINPGEKQDIEIEYDQSTAEKNPDGTINKDDGNIQDIIIQDTEKPDQSLDQNIEPEQPLPEVENPTPEQENTGPTISENSPEFSEDHYQDLEITPEEKDDLLGSLLAQTTDEEINEIEKTQSEIQEISKTIEENHEFSYQDIEYER